VRQLRPAVLDHPSPVIVAGDFNTLDYVFAIGAFPVLPVTTATGTSQADEIDRFMFGSGYESATRSFGPTLTALGIDYRLDSIFVRGFTPSGGNVERDVMVSDHFPLWADLIP